MSETSKTFLEFYKTTLDYRAKVVSIIFASGVAIAIPNIVTYLDNRSKALNEHQRQENEILLKKEEQNLKQIELQLTKAAKYQDYIAKFIEQAMNNDIEVRIRFAEYFAAVSDESDRWNMFLTKLVKKRDDLDAKKQQLAKEQIKSAPNYEEIVQLAQQVTRLEQQTRPVEKTLLGLSAARQVSPQRLLQVLGRPAKEINDQGCQQPNNEPFVSQLDTETVGKVKVTMLRPALESLKGIFAEIAQSDPPLFEKISISGALCVRNVRGSMERLSSHAFGTAVDLTLDGKFLQFGLPLPPDEIGQSMVRIAGYFEKAGWLWGAKFSLPDPGHFEVGADLFEYWVREGKLHPMAQTDSQDPSGSTRAPRAATQPPRRR